MCRLLSKRRLIIPLTKQLYALPNQPPIISLLNKFIRRSVFDLPDSKSGESFSLTHPMKGSDRENSIEKKTNEYTNPNKKADAAMRLMEAFVLKARKSCNSSLDKSNKDWMKIYAPSNAQISWMKKQKPSFKGFPNENKTIISIKKSLLNQSMIEDQKKDAKMKELESELSTAVQSKNQLEDTIQIIDKHLCELIKDNPTLIKIKEVLETVVIPQARMQNSNKELIASLQQQLREEKKKSMSVEKKLKEYEQLIGKLQTKVKSQNLTLEKFQAKMKEAQSPPKPKIPKLDLSTLKPRQPKCVYMVKPNELSHHTDSEDSSAVVPKLDLSLLHGQMQYRDEFLAKADEFSLSWRMQMEKEKRY